MKAANNSSAPSHLQALLFSKSRPKGMDDIFGGPGPQVPYLPPPPPTSVGDPYFGADLDPDPDPPETRTSD